MPVGTIAENRIKKSIESIAIKSLQSPCKEANSFYDDFGI